MTEILWKVGDRSRAVIVIPCLEVVIDPPLTFTFDGVTEKVGLTMGVYSSQKSLSFPSSGQRFSKILIFPY